MFNPRMFEEMGVQIEKFYEQGKLNHMDEAAARKYAMECMIGQMQRFNMRWCDNKINESLNREVGK